MIRHGDFTELAKSYVFRSGYSELVLGVVAAGIGVVAPTAAVVDVGAGTGKLTENLLNLGFSVTAVEPNDAMREEGIRYTADRHVQWRKGSAEETGLDTASCDWLLMGSSFHWTDVAAALREFHRVLRPGGHFTAIWNPRNLESSEFHSRIEDNIRTIVPDLERVSSGSGEFTKTLTRRLVDGGYFDDVFYVEAEHEVHMTRERYLGAWHSTNDIQVQAGPARWRQVISMLERETEGQREIVVPYRTRAWTAARRASRVG